MAAQIVSRGGRIAAGLVDGLLEASVVGSFTRLGFLARARLENWCPPADLADRNYVVTGASSGIGEAVAVGLARAGAGVWLLGRDRQRTTDAAARAAAAQPPDARFPVVPAVVDVVDRQAVRAFADRLSGTLCRLDGLVHGAGALLPSYRQSPDGLELTLATQVVAPFRLTWLLWPLLQRAPEPTIVVVSSGGMYTERFDVGSLELGPEGYRGARAYAKAKRAQVVLAHEWRRRFAEHGLASYASHPGWVDTPGLASGLPSFTHLGPLLRTPEEGADTIVWLAAGGARHPAEPSGTPVLEGFFHDRHLRREYRWPVTRPVGAPEEDDGAALWAWCRDRAGLDDVT